MTVPTLNDDQAKAIITEGLSRGMLEGSLPADPAARLKDATDLVSLVMAAAKNGKDSENINTILFLAQVDQKPPITEVSGEPSVDIKPQVALGNVNQAPPIKEEITIPTSLQNFDIEGVTDTVLDQIIAGVAGSGTDEEKYLLYIKEKRNAQTSQAKDESQGKAQKTIAEQAREAKIQSNDATNEAGSSGGDSAGNAGSQTEDASAFARAQTPETRKEAGSKNQEPTPEENERRAELEKQVTMPMIKAHGIDVTKLGKIPISKLEEVLANPEGLKEKDKMVEVNPVSSGEFSGGKPVGAVEETEFTPDIVATKEDLGLELVEEDETPSEEREKLEAMLTGPCLKAYGRGRKEIPSMGDNELRFMILNPDGKVTPAELAAAKAKDKPEVDVQEYINVAKQKEKEITAPEEADVNDKETSPDRTITEAAQEAVAKQQPTNVLTENDIITTPEIKQKFEAQNPGILTPNETIINTGQQQAMQIIAKENFPIPPEIYDIPPQLPFDVSKCSRDELFSLHARFHACESRINWVLTESEDELGDLEKLRGAREVKVAADVPLVIDDKRVTNEQRDVQVAADKEVLIFIGREHEISKKLRKLKVLQRNYMKDCERLSRQMSKYEREKNDLPR